MYWLNLIFSYNLYQLGICSEPENVSGEEVNEWTNEPATDEPTEEPKDDKETTEYVSECGPVWYVEMNKQICNTSDLCQM